MSETGAGESTDGRPVALPDGTYDVFVIDAADVVDAADVGDDAGGDHPPRTRLDLTVTSGTHRSLTFAVTAPDRLGDPIDLIGLPGTLEVSDRVPTVRIDM